MSKQNVWAPAHLVLAPELNASAKLVWLLLSQTTNTAPLHSWAGIDRRTVRTALTKLETAGWLEPPTAPGAPPIPVGLPWGAASGAPRFDVRYPTALLGNPTLGAQARVLYGQLQALSRSREYTGGFVYLDLSRRLGNDSTTLKKATTELVKAGWLTLEQPNRKRPIQFTLRNPTWDDPVEQARRRIDRARFKGEAIMREYLSLLADSAEYQDEAAPWFMINPFTSEHLRLDRYYESAKVAFEFNGLQHYVQTELITWDEFLMQSARDGMKRHYCRRDAIHLVVVHAADLSLAGMKAKIGALLPLRTLTDEDDGRLIRMLSDKAEGYRAKALPG